MEYLDPWTSKAFAVADHQIAHVYTTDVAAAREALTGLDGIAELLEGSALADAGLAHERSGELVALAERDAWFTYHYWLDNEHAPDFGRQVEIHRKPGYDPAELFFDPDDERGAKLRGGLALARKTVGMRYVLTVVGLDASKHVQGHARAAARRRRRRAGVPVLGDVGRPRSRSPRRMCATCCSTWPASPRPRGRAKRTAAGEGVGRPRTRVIRRTSRSATVRIATRRAGAQNDHARGRRRATAAPGSLPQPTPRCSAVRPKPRDRPEWPGQRPRAPRRARSP